jgi:hypothetical protein
LQARGFHDTVVLSAFMKATHFDPNNHAPEVAPDDSWGDLGDGHVGESTAKLPARRAHLEKLAAAPAGPAQAGFHIESVLARAEVSDKPHRLEVQEIGGGGIKRLDQALPKPEKVVHLGGFKEKPKHDPAAEDKTGEGETWGDEKRHPTRQYWIMGGAILGFVLLALILLPYINSWNAPTRDTSKPQFIIEELEQITGVDEMNFLYQKQNQAMELFRTYALASTVEEVIPLIHEGAAATADLTQRWRPLKLPKTWTPEPDTAWSIPVGAGRMYGLLEGFFPDQSPFTAYFTKNGTGISLDWKATSGFCTVPYSDLKNGVGDAREIRGVLTAATYYDGVWPENDYLSYRLTSPDGSQSIWCYARRGEAAEAALSLIFSKGEIVKEEQTTQKVNLHLVRGPAQSQPNQWMIQEMLQAEWLTLQERP